MNDLPRLIRILELARDAMRGEVVPGPVLAPMVDYVIEQLDELDDDGGLFDGSL
jgi:hypothetical protein